MEHLMKAGDNHPRSHPRGHRGRRHPCGFTYLTALFLVMLVGLALSGASQIWSVSDQRARERELLWVGTQYARAINAYYQQSPGLRQYPQKLEDLLEDKRFPTPRHHLRRLYADPVTRSTDWGLILTADGRIAGVHSRSEDMPWKQAEFPVRWEAFRDSQRYAEWRFVGDAGLLGSGTAPTSATGTPAPLPTRALAKPVGPAVRP